LFFINDLRPEIGWLRSSKVELDAHQLALLAGPDHPCASIDRIGKETAASLYV
jgi:hypothetical protein